MKAAKHVRDNGWQEKRMKLARHEKALGAEQTPANLNALGNSLGIQMV